MMHGGGGPMGMDGFDEESPKHFKHMIKKLGLKDDQVEKIKAIRSKYANDLKEKRKLLQEKHDDFRSAMQKDSISDMTALHQEIQKLRTDLGDLMFKIMMEIRGVLTPAQRQETHPGVARPALEDHHDHRAPPGVVPLALAGTPRGRGRI